MAVAKAKPVAPAPAQPAVKPSKPIKVKGKGVSREPEPAPKPVTAAQEPEAVQKVEKAIAKPEIIVPRTPQDVVSNLLSRETANPSGPVEPISETVNTLMRLTQSYTKGEDISDIKSEIIRIVSHQPEKGDVFQAVLNLIDRERVADATFMRAHTEKVMKRAVQRGDLTMSECFAVWEIANGIITQHEAKAAKLNKAVDTLTVVEKVDLRTLEAERLIQQKWEGTTPQGRQIIRMKLFDLKRQVKASLQPTPDPEGEPEAEEAQPAIDVK